MPIIRNATPADLAYMHEALFRLNELHHQAEPDYFMSAADISDHKNLVAYIDKNDAFAFIAEHDAMPIGFAVGEIRELKSSISKTIKMGSIEEIYVEEHYRDTGVGKTLYAAIEEHCRDRGATDLFTEVWGFNESALSFYAARGLTTHVHWLRKRL
ncbi:GNAT family N-acetyltransferase [Gilvimarinus sp. DA14]|uniref:GNAT family N-acetyltransferase n=1 Tax=Gilvimarinus sp. DA14 TaxID=2956798 RepID=UPI0020B7B2F8|nr:GNAT family N-acetyltransferase [Gilvimarinus sp. DA14]UTF58574.1 GNAT family N-acetyltransferase [Gilvimarinus sp. DA14]